MVDAFFVFTLVTGPRRSLSLNARVYEPQIRARLGTTAHLCKVVVWVDRVGPVMSTLGMMFALLHNVHGYSEVRASSSLLLSSLELSDTKSLWALNHNVHGYSEVPARACGTHETVKARFHSPAASER